LFWLSSVFLAAKGVVAAATGSVAPILAGALADFFELHQISISITWISPTGVVVIDAFRLMGLDFILILSILFGILALYRLAYVEEYGEVEERVVLEAIIAETRRNVKTISTVDGLRHTFEVPIDLTRKAVRRSRRTKKKKESEESESDVENMKED